MFDVRREYRLSDIKGDAQEAGGPTVRFDAYEIPPWKVTWKVSNGIPLNVVLEL